MQIELPLTFQLAFADENHPSTPIMIVTISPVFHVGRIKGLLANVLCNFDETLPCISSLLPPSLLFLGGLSSSGQLSTTSFHRSPFHCSGSRRFIFPTRSLPLNKSSFNALHYGHMPFVHRPFSPFFQRRLLCRLPRGITIDFVSNSRIGSVNSAAFKTTVQQVATSVKLIMDVNNRGECV